MGSWMSQQCTDLFNVQHEAYVCHDGKINCGDCNVVSDINHCQTQCKKIPVHDCVHRYGRLNIKKHSVGCGKGEKRYECGPNINWFKVQGSITADMYKEKALEGNCQKAMLMPDKVISVKNAHLFVFANFLNNHNILYTEFRMYQFTGNITRTNY